MFKDLQRGKYITNQRDVHLYPEVRIWSYLVGREKTVYGIDNLTLPVAEVGLEPLSYYFCFRHYPPPPPHSLIPL